MTQALMPLLQRHICAFVLLNDVDLVSSDSILNRSAVFDDFSAVLGELHLIRNSLVT